MTLYVMIDIDSHDVLSIGTSTYDAIKHFVDDWGRTYFDDLWTEYLDYLVECANEDTKGSSFIDYIDDMYRNLNDYFVIQEYNTDWEIKRQRASANAPAQLTHS